MENKGALLKAHAAMGTVAIFYGINYFSLKAVFDEGYSNFAILAIRCIAAVIAFWAFHHFAIGEKVTDRKDLARLALCGLFGVSLNQIFFFWGLKLTAPVNAAVLMVTTPVFVFLVAYLFRQEAFSLKKIGGLLISMGGALGLILLGTSTAVQLSGATITGDLMIMFNAASYGIYLVLVRPLVQKYNTFTIVKWIFIFGGIPNILIGIVPLVQSDFSQVSGGAVFGILWVVLATTIGAYFLNAWSMKIVPASAVGVYIYVQPVFVTLGTVIMGSRSISWLQIQFILLIFAGVWLVSDPMKGKGVRFVNKFIPRKRN